VDGSGQLFVDCGRIAHHAPLCVLLLLQVAKYNDRLDDYDLLNA
jgi:hypothetical protein